MVYNSLATGITCMINRIFLRLVYKQQLDLMYSHYNILCNILQSFCQESILHVY